MPTNINITGPIQLEAGGVHQWEAGFPQGRNLPAARPPMSPKQSPARLTGSNPLHCGTCRVAESNSGTRVRLGDSVAGR